MSGPEVLWEPPPDILRRCRMGEWLRWLEAERGLVFGDYQSAWQWSVGDLEAFWGSIWDHLGVVAHHRPERVLEGTGMPGARWFPGATLNYAENLLAAAPSGPAVVARSQTRGPRELTGPELRAAVAGARAGLAALGVGPGDRVAAYLPNIPEALIAYLAAASLGAVFSSCPPEFGTQAVIDRLAQIGPSVLLAVDGYRHKGVAIDRRREVAAIRRALPTLRRVVAVAYLEADEQPFPDAMSWAELVAGGDPLEFTPVPFDHPLCILYSSGTTGLPKAIVHGHGGILLEHRKMLALHHDLGPGSRFFWFSTTGWMMWNVVVSGLAVGASVVLFDGDPGYPDLSTLWALADDLGVSTLGLSAPFLHACAKAGLRPSASHALARLREVASTGAPLTADGFRFVHDRVGSHLRVASVSGGTDVCTAFVGGSPLLPVVAGEITCRLLGARVEAFDRAGRPVVGTEASLVVTAPMPSMPVGLWGDDDGSQLRAAYFEEFPGVWSHGDWITITERGSCIITGRSDATLNRGGVRLGTAEFYSVVEARPEIADSLVVHLEDLDGGPGRLVLFVVVAPGSTLDDGLRRALADDLRRALSPRHAPDDIVAVAEVPRTLSGKKLEIPVKRILRGAPASEVASADSLVNPAALGAFEVLAGDLSPGISHRRAVDRAAREQRSRQEESS